MSSYQIIDHTNGVPDISVAMLAYNHGEYIVQALESVLMQKTKYSYKIVIAEDFSTDNTREILLNYQKMYPSIFKLILQDKNVGANANNTCLLKNLEGRYIAALEADDYWIDPLKLQKQVEMLEACPDIGLVHTKFKIYNQSENSFSLFELSGEYKRQNQFTAFLYQGGITTLTMIFRSSYLIDILNMLEQDFMLNSPVGDRPIQLLIGLTSKFAYLDDVTGVYRISGNDSASNFKSKIQSYRFHLKVEQINIELYSYLKMENLKYLRFLIRKNMFMNCHFIFLKTNGVSL